ncbi:54S ribosomal protein L44, mitochondrial [Komagataella phaffii CBS 7435]|uniref:Large ribosomal subunit protein mL53 n=2 Tax=Komagataella phaffii TaxID=460519 RepID=C4QVB1_KOMPG|nr:mitochondrial 54S ribosomal protein YmL44 [Komagataella phaffii GS115]CAH2445839.1 54S ribosomal protein L44, mitochondrial [Komagataella phaffii CBS 7435]CAY67184.1 Mitochondrial ribosomal protein of the large subunit [Komagataella phaffii GS115]CCA36294.2 54S ribosomal protein L44, mitochondrial [Komagataella phaffii CBS 7435]
MITKYFTKVSVKFNPFGPEAKGARLFLAALPSSLKKSCTINYEVLNSQSNKKPIIEVTYKDKKTLDVNPTSLNFNELSNLFDRHSRKLQLEESIQG